MIYHGGPSNRYGCDYYDLDGLQDTVDQTVATLTKKRRYIKPDCIVVTGLSGVIVGVPVSLAMDIPLVVFRKDNDCAHAMSMGERALNLDHLGQQALWLDDFVANGETRKRIFRLVEENGGQLVGQYLYRDDKLTFGASWSKLRTSLAEAS